MPFSILFSMMSCMYSYKLKIEESVKNDVEIDTIDNDDEKESLEVSKNMTQYPTSSSAKLRVSKTLKKIESEIETPSPTSPPSFKFLTFGMVGLFFLKLFGHLHFWVPLEDNKSCIFWLECPLELCTAYYLLSSSPPPHTSRKCVLSETVLILL